MTGNESLNQLTDEELDHINGGAVRYVYNSAISSSVVRSGPGITYGQIGSLNNGVKVHTTGMTHYNPQDGRTWYEIDFPLYGWIAGSLLGYQDHPLQT